MTDTNPRVRQRDREIAERALDRWGAWRGLRGSLQLRDAMAEAIRDERERCAIVAESAPFGMTPLRIGARIRARWKAEPHD